MSLASRVKRLAARRVPPAECPAPRTTVLLSPGKEPPADAARCPRCGGQHPIMVIEEVVQSPVRLRF
jgi:hypothetical protein